MNCTRFAILRRPAAQALPRQRFILGQKRSRAATVVALMSALLAAGPGATAQSPLDSGFSFQGQLKMGGQPLSSSADFVFLLRDAEFDGNLIAGPVPVSTVTVYDGLFAVQVDFGAGAFDGGPRWLEISVRSPAGGGTFTPLAPLQPITSTPHAQIASKALSVTGVDGHSLDAEDGDPVDALFVTADGKVGIGTSTPGLKLTVDGGIESTSVGFRFPDGSLQTTATSGDAHSLDAQDGDPTDALFVDVDGDVGIGTVTPAAQLQIHKSSESPADTIRLDASPDENPRIAFTVGGQSAALIRLHDADQDQLKLTIFDSLGGLPIDALTIATSGNVGIQETDPQTLLAINDGAGAAVGITQNQVGGSSGMELTTSDTLGSQATRMLLRGGLDNPNIEFYRGARGAEAESMVIKGDTGSVGIGTSDPAAQLQIHKSSESPADTIRLDASPDENPRIAFTVDNQVGARIRLNDSANDQLQFTVFDTLGGSANTALSIATSGNIGIGVADPETLLALDIGLGNPVGVTQNQVAGTSSFELTTSDDAGAQATRFLMRGNSDDGDIEFYRGARGAEQQTAIIDGATGFVGIGTRNPDYPLHVATDGVQAIYGIVTATTGVSTGVFGRSNSESGRGVYGYATANIGINVGGGFQSDSTSGYGVIGTAVAASGDTYGVHGQVASPNGTAVRGLATANSGLTYGVYGQSNSDIGTGVYGEGQIGVEGKSDGSMGTGVYGKATSASGFSSGVEGVSESPDGHGVFGINTSETGSAIGVRARSDSSTGQAVYGVSSSTTGTARGGEFRSASPDGAGAFGINTSSTGSAYGVHGSSSSGTGRGVFAEATAIAGGTQNYGVYAIARGLTGRGVYGEATSAQVNYGVRGRTQSTIGYGVFSIGDFGGSGAKYFVQPHPSDPSKEIRFISLEGNESGTYFRGSQHLAGGRAVIEVPEEFALVTELDGLTVQVTAMGPNADLWVETKNLDRIVVRGDGDVEFDYFVNGVRRGFANHEPIRDNHEYVPELRGVPYGTQYREGHRRILVENGILNADFTPNEETAARMGWTLKDPEPADPPAEQLQTRTNRQDAPANMIESTIENVKIETGMPGR